MRSGGMLCVACRVERDSPVSSQHHRSPAAIVLRATSQVQRKIQLSQLEFQPSEQLCTVPVADKSLSLSVRNIQANGTGTVGTCSRAACVAMSLDRMAISHLD